MKVLRTDPDYLLLETAEDLDQIITEIMATEDLVFDLETTSLDTRGAKIIGVGLKYEARNSYYCPVLTSKEDKYEDNWKKVRDVLAKPLEDPTIRLHGHNILEYDAQVLYWNGIRCQGLTDDTQIIFRILQSDFYSAGLDALALRYFNYVKIKTSSLIGTGKKKTPMFELPVEDVGTYCCEDVDYSWKLREALLEELRKTNTWGFYENFRPVVQAVFNMYTKGLRVDTKLLKEIDNNMTKEIEPILEKLRAMAGKDFNPNATQQKAALLYDKLKLNKKHKVRVPMTQTGKRQVTEAIVTALAEKEGPESAPALLLAYTKANKIRSTYSTGYAKLLVEHPDGTKRIHPTISLASVSTGRASCKRPNLQNCPRPDNKKVSRGTNIRRCFVPDDGYLLIDGDLSQIELRVVAHYSEDPFMKEAYETGTDIHSLIAARIYDVEKPTKTQRSSAKTISFGLLYGMGEFRLAKTLDCSLEEARILLAEYFQRFPSMKYYLDSTENFAREHGWVTNLFGRRRYVPYINSADPILRRHDRNRAVNHPIQSSVAHMIERAMIAIDRELHSGVVDGHMLLQVHDEILIQVREDEAEDYAKHMKEIMESVVELSVPIKADVHTARTWYEAH